MFVSILRYLKIFLQYWLKYNIFALDQARKEFTEYTTSTEFLQLFYAALKLK